VNADLVIHRMAFRETNLAVAQALRAMLDRIA
jgi:hypothetical protein